MRSRSSVRGWVSAGGDLATSTPLVVGLPGWRAVTLERGGLATSSVSKRTWLRGGERQHHLIDTRTGAPARNRWRDVTVAAPTCLDADVAAKAALLLGEDGPSWLDERNLRRPLPRPRRRLSSRTGGGRAAVPLAAVA